MILEIKKIVLFVKRLVLNLNTRLFCLVLTVGCGAKSTDLMLSKMLGFKRKGSSVDYKSQKKAKMDEESNIEVLSEVGIYLSKSEAISHCMVAVLSKEWTRHDNIKAERLIHSILMNYSLPELKGGLKLGMEICSGGNVIHAWAKSCCEMNNANLDLMDEIFAGARLRYSIDIEARDHMEAVNNENYHGNTALHIAVINLNVELVQKLVDMDINTEVKNIKGAKAGDLLNIWRLVDGLSAVEFEKMEQISRILKVEIKDIGYKEGVENLILVGSLDLFKRVYRAEDMNTKWYINEFIVQGGCEEIFSWILEKEDFSITKEELDGYLFLSGPLKRKRVFDLILNSYISKAGMPNGEIQESLTSHSVIGCLDFATHTKVKERAHLYIIASCKLGLPKLFIDLWNHINSSLGPMDKDLIDLCTLYAIDSDSKEIVKFLEGRGSGINELIFGETKLGRAARECRRGVAKMLKEMGAKDDVLNFCGQSPLYRATCTGDVDIVKIILGDGPYNSLDSSARRGTTAPSLICLAFNRGHIGVVELLISRGGSIDEVGRNGYTLLQSAVDKGDVEDVKTLMKMGANANLVDSRGVSPIRKAIKRKNVKIIRALEMKD